MKRPRLLRIDCETPLKGQWFEIESRAFAARNRTPLLEKIIAARELGNQEDADMFLHNTYEDELLTYIGGLIVEASDFFERDPDANESPYLEFVRDLWGPEGLAVTRGFFAKFTGKSQTPSTSQPESSADQNSSET